MALTQDEIVALARRVAVGDLHTDIGDWWSPLAPDEQRQILTYAIYEIERRRLLYRQEDRRAQRLLRAWLTLRQCAELRYTRAFTVVGSAGGRYRLRPNVGQTSRLERHGKYYYDVATYCYHDEARDLPAADLTLAHYLLLITDEPGFLAVANEHKRTLSQWDGAWKRRLNAARRLRVHQVAA